jgi:hypothetical protein
MRTKMRPVSLIPAVLPVLLFFCGISIPVFASGDDKSPAPISAPKSAEPAPDREKKVYTNDDIARMRPKDGFAVVSVPQVQAQAGGTAPDGTTLTIQPVSPEKDPLWYAKQVVDREAELDRIANKEERSLEFRASGSTSMLPGVHIGLRLNAPCEGITTDNEIAQLDLRRQEIEEQLGTIADAAQENDLPAGILRDAPAILAAAEKPLTPDEELRALAERQALLADQLNATQDELSYMSDQAAAIGANLQPPTPGFGGNMTTDLIERLDNRANQIQVALDQTDDNARRIGAVQP